MIRTLLAAFGVTVSPVMSMASAAFQKCIILVAIRRTRTVAPAASLKVSVVADVGEWAIIDTSFRRPVRIVSSLAEAIEE